jgi:hypothetical protein
VVRHLPDIHQQLAQSLVDPQKRTHHYYPRCRRCVEGSAATVQVIARNFGSCSISGCGVSASSYATGKQAYELGVYQMGEVLSVTADCAMADDVVSAVTASGGVKLPVACASAMSAAGELV